MIYAFALSLSRTDDLLLSDTSFKHFVRFLEGVPPDIWEFHIGGYQALQKWLKDRKDRRLEFSDIHIVAALRETMTLMERIEEHGGWPIA